jgi:predicted solute-binding protein
MEVSEAKRPRQLEEENRQLKFIVAEQAVDIRALKALAVAFLFRNNAQNKNTPAVTPRVGRV